MEKLQLWKYRHYKGKDYEVLWECIWTEDNIEYVIYKALYTIEWYPDWQLWVRPKEMFLGNETYNSEIVKRFTFIWK